MPVPGARIPDQFTQQDAMRRFDARLGSVMRVLRQLAELGVVERRPGNGWAFVPDPARILNESYAFRRALEPQILLQPGFGLDRDWAQKAREEHLSLRKKPGAPAMACAFMPSMPTSMPNLRKSSGNRAMLRAVERHNQLRQFLIGRLGISACAGSQRDRRSSGNSGGAGSGLCR